MNLADLIKRLDALRRETEQLKIMQGFLPADDPIIEATTDRLERETIELMQRIKKAEDDFKQ
jgi:hypothetical protein